jgi:hypothetical protein
MTNFTESTQWLRAIEDSKIVVEVTYVLTAELNGKKDKCLRRIVLDAPDPAAFIPFENLTEQDVLSWAREKLGVDEIDAMKNGMSSKLGDLPANMVVDVVAPWENPVENA